MRRGFEGKEMAGEAGQSNMFITRDRYVWLESRTSAGVYEALIVYCQTLDGMDGGRVEGGREEETVLVEDMPGYHACPEPSLGEYQTARLESRWCWMTGRGSRQKKVC